MFAVDNEITNALIVEAIALQDHHNFRTDQFSQLVKFPNLPSNAGDTNDSLNYVNNLFTDAHTFSDFVPDFWNRVLLAIENNEVLIGADNKFTIAIADDLDENFNQNMLGMFYNLRAFQILRPDVFEKILGRQIKTTTDFYDFQNAFIRFTDYINEQATIPKMGRPKKTLSEDEKRLQQIKNEKRPEKRPVGRPASKPKSEKQLEAQQARDEKKFKKGQINLIRSELANAKACKKKAAIEWDEYIEEINARYREAKL